MRRFQVIVAAWAVLIAVVAGQGPAGAQAPERAPAPVQGLTASGDPSGRILLIWGRPGPDIDARVYRDGSLLGEGTAAGRSAQSFSDETASEGVVHRYEVRSHDDAGESEGVVVAGVWHRPARFRDRASATGSLPLDWADFHRVAGALRNGDFGFDLPLGRVQAAEWFWRAFARPEVATSHPWRDVSDSSGHAEALSWLAANGVGADDGGGAFRPGRTITRMQTVRWLWRLAGSPPVGTYVHPYVDVAHRGPRSVAVGWARHWFGAAMPIGRDFKPARPASREMVIDLLWSLMATERAWRATPSGHVQFLTNS